MEGIEVRGRTIKRPAVTLHAYGGGVRLMIEDRDRPATEVEVVIPAPELFALSSVVWTERRNEALGPQTT